MTSLTRVRHDLLNQLLNLPQLVQNIQALPAEKFHDIIKEIGIEDSGELVTIATTAQLQDLFDIDVWSNHVPGEVEHFDSARFWKWMEILFDAGESVLLEKVIEMDEELLTFALASQLFVFPTERLDAFFRTEDDAAHQVDMKLESCLCEELYEYQLIARNPETWDLVFTLLVALDKEHHTLLLKLLPQLSVLGEQRVEEEDLSTVLSDIEAMFENVTDKREQRRLSKGYVSSRDARAFLRLVQVKSPREIIEQSAADPISSAYFRHYAPDDTVPHSASSAYQDIIDVLTAQELLPTTPRAVALLPGETVDNAQRLLLALQALAGLSDELFHQRNAELGFLGNVIAAGCTLHGERFRTVDASTAVTATCALGVEIWTADNERSFAPWTDILTEASMMQLFLLGWSRLAEQDFRAFPYFASGSEPWVPRFFDSILSLDQNPVKR